mmetsp:Transcript_82990/g.130906  ORF Transcript_82990/g.130906 Transcript_82990/m.130906 type:complete len:255 (+) Transcript_82990:1020-1784(+)
MRMHLSRLLLEQSHGLLLWIRELQEKHVCHRSRWWRWELFCVRRFSPDAANLPKDFDRSFHSSNLMSSQLAAFLPFRMLQFTRRLCVVAAFLVGLQLVLFILQIRFCCIQILLRLSQQRRLRILRRLCCFQCILGSFVVCLEFVCGSCLGLGRLIFLVLEMSLQTLEQFDDTARLESIGLARLCIFLFGQDVLLSNRLHCTSRGGSCQSLAVGVAELRKNQRLLQEVQQEAFLPNTIWLHELHKGRLFTCFQIC